MRIHICLQLKIWSYNAQVRIAVPLTRWRHCETLFSILKTEFTGRARIFSVLSEVGNVIDLVF